MSSRNHPPSLSLVSDDDGFSARPPTYASFSANTAPPTYVSDTTSVQDPHERVNSWRGHVQSGSSLVLMHEELQPQDTSSVHDASTDGTSSPIPHHREHTRLHDTNYASENLR
jgi:hypothetical protein